MSSQLSGRSSARGARAPLCVVVAALALAGAPALRAEIVAAQGGLGAWIASHAENASGNATPIGMLDGSSVALNSPGQLAVDPIRQELFVGEGVLDFVQVYALPAVGDVAPLRVLEGAATLLASPLGVTVDLINDELLVANFVNGTNGAINVYPRAANGNTAPLRRIEGAAAGLSWLVNIAVSPLHNEIYVTCQGVTEAASVRVFDRLATGNVAPKRVIQGNQTGLGTPFALIFDPVRDELLVTDRNGAVRAFARTASGNVAPLRTIAGAQTQLLETVGVALIGDSELVVSNQGGNDTTDDALLVFGRNASGNVAPRRKIQGPATQVAGPIGVVVPREPLLLHSGRFMIEATWRTDTGGIGGAEPVALTTDTGYLYFFGPDNVEVVVKVLDACPLNQRFWVFVSGLTNVDVELKVTDLATGHVKHYTNPQGTPYQPIQDTNAFATCGAGFAGQADDTAAADASAASAMHPLPSLLCTGLCLNNDRFEITATWRTADGATGQGHGVGITADTGYQWFFGPENVETVVKVLNGCAVNGRYWVFAAGLSNVGVDLTVRDTQTGATKTYTNRLNQPFQPIQDTSAFQTCP